jgi:hypothetical protein
MLRGGKVWLGDDSATPTLLSTELTKGVSGAYLGAAWLNSAVAIWDEDKAVEAFELSGAHERRYRYEVALIDPHFGSATIRHGGFGQGELLVLTTYSGIRIHDRQGNLVGGAEPLPCALLPSSGAVSMGPQTIAVPAGRYAYVFDLARYGAGL